MKDRKMQQLSRMFASVLDGDLVRAEHRDGGTMTITRPVSRKKREGDDDNPPSPDDDVKPKRRQIQFEIPVAFPLEVVGSAYVMAEDREQARALVEHYARGGENTAVTLEFPEGSLMDLRYALNDIRAGRRETCGQIRVHGEPRPAAQYLLTHG
jgi:hypothetical protein